MSGSQQAAGVEKGPSGFFSSVLMLAGGTAVAQAVGIATAPAITRLFTPEAFGLAAVVGTLFAILAPVAGGKYDAAVPLPREDERAASLLGLSLLLLLATTVAVALAMLAFGRPLLDWLEAAELEPHAWVLPLGILAAGGAYPLRAWYVRQRRFRTLAGVDLVHATATSLASIGAGMLGFVAGLDLVLVRIATQAIVPAWLGAWILARDWRFIRPHWRRDELAALARRYADFPRFTVGENVLNSTSRGLPTLLLASQFGAGAAGLFALAHRIVFMPSQLVGSATSQVLFQRIAEMRANDRPAGLLMEQVIVRLSMFGLPATAALAVAGPALFGTFFGADWQEAGRYAAALSPWLLTAIVASPLTVLWSVFERQRLALIFNVALLGARLGALLGGAWFSEDPAVALASFGAVGIVFNLTMVSFFARLTAARLRPVALGFLRWAAIAAACAVVPWALQHLAEAPPRVVVGGVVVQALLYGLAILWLDAELRRAALGWLASGRAGRAERKS